MFRVYNKDNKIQNVSAYYIFIYKVILENKLWYTFYMKMMKLNKGSSVSKIVLKNSIPSILIMFFTGLYLFFDDIASINFASDSYETTLSHGGLAYSPVELIRMSLSFSLNILYIVEAIILLFSIGSSIKYASLVAEGDEEKIKSFLSTSFKYTLGFSILLIPILIGLSKPWIEFQYHLDPYIKSEVMNMAFDYLWVVIIGTPFIAFAQYVAAILRAEQKNIIALIIIGAPLLLNLLFDYIFMGLLDFGVQGGAWATFISYITSALVASIFIFTMKDKHLSNNVLWSFKDIRFGWIIWIVVIGSAPFIRNFTQSFTESFEANNFNRISDDVYSSTYENTMSEIYVNSIPIYNIIFPIMFGYIHSISPIISKERAKGHFLYIRKIVFHTLIQSAVISGVFFGAVILSDSYLLELMKIDSHRGDIVSKTKIVLKILLLSVIALVPMIVSLTTFTGAQMNKTAIFISLLRMMLFVPFILIWNKITWDHNQSGLVILQNYYQVGDMGHVQYLFWWYYPSLALGVSFISSIPLILTFGRKSWCHKMIKKHNEKQAS